MSVCCALLPPPFRALYREPSRSPHHKQKKGSVDALSWELVPWRRQWSINFPFYTVVDPVLRSRSRQPLWLQLDIVSQK